MKRHDPDRAKWLFVLRNYLPEPDANGNCVAKLRSELVKMGIRTDVLRVRMNKSEIPDEMEDEAGTVYSADTWMRLGHLGRFDRVSKLRKGLRMLRVIPARGWHYLTNGMHVDEKAYGPNACRGLKKRIEQLCRENGYDWVIAVSVPFCTQETAASADLSGARLAFYSLDPYSRNHSFSKKNEAKRIAEEMAVMEKTEVHFVSLEHRQDWQREPQNRCFSKIRFTPYPNLVQPQTDEGRLPDGFFDGDRINCVYIGSFLDGIRSPRRMLELFENMAAADSRIRLHVIGKREGMEQAAMLAEYKKRMGDALKLHGVYDFQTASAIMRSADVLVNIGNLIPNQMPSKLLDYIAAGKPIICISELEPCNMEPYWSRYPLMYHINAQQSSDAAAAAEAAKFCAENKGKSVEWETVRECCRGFVAEDVAAYFAQELAALS